MPTYQQLQAEPWWGQEIVTDELDWLVDQLCAHYGVPRGNGGTKGDNRHLNGGHRSQRWILNSAYCTNRTYSVEAGLPTALVNDIAAFDVTLPLQHMLTISRNADRATRAGQLEELVEWFGNVDGDERVDGWNNIENRIASSDSSHLWHFHGRIRRSLLRDMATMRRILAALTSTGDDDVDLKDTVTIPLYEAFDTVELPKTETLTVGSLLAGAYRRSYVAMHLAEQTREAVADLAKKFGEPVDVEVLEAEPLDLDALADKVAARLGDAFADLVADKLAARLAS